MSKSARHRGGTQKTVSFSLRLPCVTQRNTESDRPEKAQIESDTIAVSAGSEDEALSPVPASGRHVAESQADANEVQSPVAPDTPLQQDNPEEALPPSWQPLSQQPQTEDPTTVSATASPVLPTPRVDDTPDPLEGTTIDARYVIEKRIARGGMATVYRAKDTRLDRPVALKIMYPHLAESADFVARFRREARAAAKLTHPGVVAVYDQGSANSSSYLVMELVKGPNLRNYLRANGCLTIGESLSIMKQVLGALGAAHALGLVHRDVKPENVLMPPRGPVKVADFGLARAASEATAATTGSILGTVAYLSPETVSGEHADARVDVYAAGIMLYELIAGVPPFQGSTPIQIAYSHVHNDTPSLRASFPWVPEAVDELVSKLTMRDPEKRPADGSEASELLDRVLSGLTPEEKELKGDAPPTLDSAATYMAGLVTPTLAEVPLPKAPRNRRGKRRQGLREKPAARAGGTPSAANSSQTRRHSLRGKVVASVVAVGAILALTLTWFFLWGPGSYRPMIDVVNQRWSDATKNLEKNDIEFERIDEFNDTIPAGNVSRSDPAPQKALGRFQKAKIYVSKGIEMLTVPDLAGKTQKQAQDIITKARFDKPRISQAYSDTVPAGQVASQEPKAGKSVAHYTVLKVVISKGRQPVVVPQLTGKILDEANTILKQVGLVPSVTEEFSDTVEKGKVISQSVDANQTAYRGDVINLVVSKGPQMVEMPNLVGKSESQARAALEGMGLKVKVDRVYALVGIVAETNPKAGAKVKVGSTVTLRVI